MVLKNINPIPKNAPTMPLKHPSKGIKATAVYRYYDEHENLIGAVLRFDFENEHKEKQKLFLPCSLWGNGKGLICWQFKLWEGVRPLYNRHLLAKRPDAPVIVCEGEKAADAAQSFLPDYVAVTSPNGSQAASKADWGALEGREVVLWPDNDTPGFQYCKKVAELLITAKAKSIKTIVPIKTWPSGYDAADLKEEKTGCLKIALERIDKAKETLIIESEPPPLIKEDLTKASSFPLHELGDLEEGARAIAAMVEAPDATVALSVLAVASLAAQGHANVEINSRTYPLSLFCFTIAESGDRKSSVDKVALTPIEDYRRDRFEAYQLDKKQWYINHAAWKAQKEAILKETAKATTLDTRRQKLEELGEEPNPPLDPDLIIPSSTIEGIARNWDKMQPSIGLFSDEGGNFLGGYGFKSENKIYTTTALTSLWGDGEIKKLTSGNGKENVKGKRLAIHLMVQPLIGDEFFKDKAMENQGFTNRFLIACPESKKGYRRNEEPTGEQLKAISRYSDKIAVLLRVPLTINPDGNQLSPFTLLIEGEAKTALKKFSDQCELEQRPEGKFCEISGFASRACEHACRLAGVLQLVNDPYASTISKERMINAINLMVWFLNERIRLTENGKVKPEQGVSEKILDWCKKQSEQEIRKTAINQNAPYAARQDKALFKKALSILIEEGLLIKTKDSPESYCVTGRSS